MEIQAYLTRIGYDGPREPTAAALRALHLAHLRAVPFENLDIPMGRPIRLELPALAAKIVGRSRGGYCFELNGLFGWLLAGLGFSVTMLSAAVIHHGEPGADFEHALLLVDGPEPSIADVGFGDSFLTPLPLVRGREETQAQSGYRLTGAGPDWILEQRAPGADWLPQYGFTLAARELREFVPMSDYLSTSPDSPFARKAVCSLATVAGRVTLSGSRLIETANGERVETEVGTAAEYRRHLRARFGMELDPGAPIHRLMALNRPS